MTGFTLSQETALFMRCDIRMELSDEDSKIGRSTRECLAGFVPMTTDTRLRRHSHDCPSRSVSLGIPG
jgi:hypothetical protein